MPTSNAGFAKTVSEKLVITSIKSSLGVKEKRDQENKQNHSTKNTPIV